MRTAQQMRSLLPTAVMDNILSEFGFPRVSGDRPWGVAFLVGFIQVPPRERG